MTRGRGTPVNRRGGNTRGGRGGGQVRHNGPGPQSHTTPIRGGRGGGPRPHPPTPFQRAFEAQSASNARPQEAQVNNQNQQPGGNQPVGEPPIQISSGSDTEDDSFTDEDDDPVDGDEPYYGGYGRCYRCSKLD